jgi:hypothetical protein
MSWAGRQNHPAFRGGPYTDRQAGFKKNVNRATTQVMMKTGMSLRIMVNEVC